VPNNAPDMGGLRSKNPLMLISGVCRERLRTRRSLSLETDRLCLAQPCSVAGGYNLSCSPELS
jgi:hypothetical protein